MPSTSLQDEPPSWAVAWATALLRDSLIQDKMGEQGDLCSVTPIRSNEVNTVLRLVFEGGVFFLKVGPHLRQEAQRLQWLQGRLPAPYPIGYASRNGVDALLMTAVEGDDLALLSASLPPEVVVARLVRALHTLHATDITEWPYGGGEGVVYTEAVLVHGDACLPNFLFRGETLSGYIDVGDMTLAHPDVDLAAAVWTLQRNLGAGYGLPFLHAYGRVDADEAEVERLRALYEAG